MNSKKGVVKTLEAVIAIIAILGFIYAIFPEKKEITGEVPAEVKAAEEYVLTEIALNKEYRKCVTDEIGEYVGACKNGCLDQINDLVKSRAPSGYATMCEVCDTALSCTSEDLPAGASIYTDSIFIARHPVKKVVRVYFYEKETTGV